MGMQSFSAIARVFGVSILAVLSFSQMGCTNKEAQGLRLNAAPEEIQSSFRIESKQVAGAPQTLIALKKSSLEQYFMMIPQARLAEAASSVTLFEPEVVYFKAQGSSLALFELNGASFYDDLKEDRLIQTFPIVSETADEILFSWQMGLKAISSRSSMGSRPSESEDKSFSDGIDPSIEVLSSFIEKADIQNNVLRVRQKSRIRSQILHYEKSPSELDPEGDGNVGSVEFHDQGLTLDVVIRPYQKGTGLQPKTSKISKGFGYFTKSIARRGWSDLERVIERWDIDPAKGPIRVRVSSRVPVDLILAVKEGVEYWNRILGRNVLNFEPGVSPNATIEERTIMIHWVDWQDAGFAYAGFQADPLTGEILQGQVFLTSSWLLSAISYGDLKGSLARQKPAMLGPVGARRQDFGCQYHVEALRELGSTLAGQTQGAALDEASAHVIRAVVAHEMGHALGLRHNFAGSFNSQVPRETQLKASLDFLKEGTLAALPASSSIMEYSSALDDLFIGKYIQTGALDYDRKVIAWGYLGDESVKSLGFCTDEDYGADKKVIGCKPFDSSPFPTDIETQLSIWMRPRALWRDHGQVVSELTDPLEPKEIDEILSNKEGLLANTPTAASYISLRTFFSGERSVLSTKALKNWEKPDEVKKAKTDSWKAQVDAVGLLRVFDLALPLKDVSKPDGSKDRILDLDYWQKTVDKALASPRFDAGKTGNGLSYALSNEQHARLEKYLRLKLADSPFEPGLKALTQVFPGAKKADGKDVSFAVFESFKKEMPEVLGRSLALMRATSEVKVVEMTEGEVTKVVAVPVKVFAPALFKEWIGLFDPRYNPNSSSELKDTLLKELKRDLAPVYQVWGLNQTDLLSTSELRRIYKEKAVNSPDEVKEWVDGELSLLESFEKALAP